LAAIFFSHGLGRDRTLGICVADTLPTGSILSAFDHQDWLRRRFPLKCASHEDAARPTCRDQAKLDFRRPIIAVAVLDSIWRRISIFGGAYQVMGGRNDPLQPE